MASTRIIEDIPLIVRETHTDHGVPIRAALDQMLGAYIGIASHRSAAAAGALPHHRCGAQGRGRGQRRHGLLGHPAAGRGQRRSAVPAGQGGPAFGAGALCRYRHGRSTTRAERVVVGQRATQGSPDIFLGWGEVDGRHFYVRQLADMKGSASFVEGDNQGIAAFIEYCGLCGWALALAHAKSGDPAMIAGYCGARPRSTTPSPSSRWPTPGRPMRTTRRSTRRAAPAASGSRPKAW